MSPDPPPRIENIEDIRAWILDHHARIEAWWNEQHRWNKKMEKNHGDVTDSMGACKCAVLKEVEDMKERVHKLETRLALIFGIAIVVGQILGYFMTRLV